MVAYEAEVDEDHFDIYKIEMPAMVPELAFEDGRHPSLTTDGALFFTRYEETVWGDYWKSYCAGTRGLEEITSNTVFTELEPTVSRDGRYVVFSSTRAGSAEIIYVPLSHTEPTVRITKNTKEDVEPTIDGRGEYIYYTVIAGDQSYIYRVKSDGSGNERISASAGNLDRHPSVSADNKLLAFSSERDGNSEIYVMDLRERTVTRLTTHEEWDGHPCISSDGKWIAFASDRDGNREIYAIDSEGNSLIRLTNNDIPDDYPAIN
jgi:TolB protein